MRSALLDRRSGSRKSSKRFLPAPVSGINVRDNPLNLKPTDALDLVNFIAYPDRVESRSGSALVCATPAAVHSLLSYSDGGNTYLFAAGATAVYNVTTSTYSTAFSCTDADYMGFNFASGGANYLYALNGVDAPQLFNGTTWQAVTTVSAPISITGISPADLIAGTPYNERLFFLKPNKKSFYYLPVGAVGGVLTEFPVGRYLSKGGSLVAISTISQDGGDGLQTFLVVASSEGEILIYFGTDPADPADWKLRGSYVVGRPLNKHAFMPYGSDTLYLCESGLYGLVTSLSGAKTGNATTVSDKVSPLLSRLITTYGEDLKWRMAFNPLIPGIILNIPTASGEQFFQHSRSGAWSRFESWIASDFHYVDGECFYASTDGVHQCFIGTADEGLPITAKSFGAPVQLGGGGTLTETVGIRPWFKYEGAFTYGLSIFNDLTTETIQNLYSTAGTGGLIWNVGNWNEATWGGEVGGVSDWRTPDTYPTDRVSLGLQIYSGAGGISWLGCDWAFLVSNDW